jgi:hypothetical protein
MKVLYLVFLLLCFGLAHANKKSIGELSKCDYELTELLYELTGSELNGYHYSDTNKINGSQTLKEDISSKAKMLRKAKSIDFTLTKCSGSSGSVFALTSIEDKLYLLSITLIKDNNWRVKDNNWRVKDILFNDDLDVVQSYSELLTY